MTQNSAALPYCYDDVWAEAYGDLQDVGPVHRHMRRMLAGLLAGLEYETVVDVGCGAGHNLPLLGSGRRLRRVCGLDVSAEALRRARRRSDAEFLQLDIQSDRHEDSFDLVFCSLVLEHLPDDLAALRNMRAMANRFLVVTTIAGDFERYRPWEVQMGHVRNYQPGELEGKLEAAGFAPDRVIYWGFPFYSPIARRLQNRMRSQPSYGLPSRALAALMHAVYFLNSNRRGDLVLAVARTSDR